MPTDYFERTPKCLQFENMLSSLETRLYPMKVVDSCTMYIEELMKEFNLPFVVQGISDKFGISVLKENQTLSDVASIVGPKIPIRLIEVGCQNEVEWFLGEFADYLKQDSSRKILNMISLEISNTKLNKVIQAPQLVRDIDWIDTIWPQARKLNKDYPRVQKYCLSGMASSYTDFHIDFGGTSVWYHVVNGRKRFYLIAPTLRNLRLYTQWQSEDPSKRGFFGDAVGMSECFTYDLTPGNTLMLPSGWIHAVYTPELSLVFGGNFPHKNGILQQLQVDQIEERNKDYIGHRLPLFRQMHWYALCKVLPLAVAKYLSGESEKLGKKISEGGSNPEVIAMSEGLGSSAHMFCQFVLLVKVAEEWMNQKMNKKDAKAFQSIAEECAEVDSVEAVLQQWWSVLESVAAGLDTAAGAADAQFNVSYLHFIRSVEEPLDLLDEQVVGRAMASFDSQLSALNASPDCTPDEVNKASHSPVTAAAAVPGVSSGSGSNSQKQQRTPLWTSDEVKPTAAAASRRESKGKTTTSSPSFVAGSPLQLRRPKPPACSDDENEFLDSSEVEGEMSSHSVSRMECLNKTREMLIDDFSSGSVVSDSDQFDEPAAKRIRPTTLENQEKQEQQQMRWQIELTTLMDSVVEEMKSETGVVQNKSTEQKLRGAEDEQEDQEKVSESDAGSMLTAPQHLLVEQETLRQDEEEESDEGDVTLMDAAQTEQMMVMQTEQQPTDEEQEEEYDDDGLPVVPEGFHVVDPQAWWAYLA